MEALSLLDGKTYLAKGMIREYVFELSDIFKRYIERRFGDKCVLSLQQRKCLIGPSARRSGQPEKENSGMVLQHRGPG